MNLVVVSEDPALRDGWGRRLYNWEFTAGVQREISRGLSMDVLTLRRRSVGRSLEVRASSSTTALSAARS